MSKTLRAAIKACPLVSVFALVSCASLPAPSVIETASRESDRPFPAFSTSRPQGPTGTIALTIHWPDRPAYTAQVIPLRTNALIIQVLDASNHVTATQTIVRPQSGPSDITANLEVAAAHGYRLRVAAYQEQTPAYDSVPIAEGEASDVAIEPSTEATVRISLVPTEGPELTSVPLNGGPLSYVVLSGRHFEGWGGPVKVTFGGVESPAVSGTSTQLMALIPNHALDGPIAVTADGVTAVSPGAFRIIRSLTLAPDAATTRVGSPVQFTATARDTVGSLIDVPVLTWGFLKTSQDEAFPPEPVSILSLGEFTPGSTGSFEISVCAGSVRATASLTVN